MKKIKFEEGLFTVFSQYDKNDKKNNKKWQKNAHLNEKLNKEFSLHRTLHPRIRSVRVRSFFWSVFSRIWTKYRYL